MSSIRPTLAVALAGAVCLGCTSDSETNGTGGSGGTGGSAGTGGSGGTAGTAAGSMPNVVLVYADDLGYGDLSSYGNTDIDTPNLDRMAAEGVRFTQFYSAHGVCSPSRAALLTGRYPARTVGSTVFSPQSEEGLDPEEVTIAELLKDQGYATALVGKWHLGHLPEFLPMAQGFDQFYGLPYSNDMNAPHYPGEEPPPEHPCDIFQPDCRPGVPLMEGDRLIEEPAIQETLTKRYTHKAIEFIQTSVASETPFFLYYANHFPHTPLYASEDFLGTSDGGLYGDVVEELDWSVGEILREIQALGVDEKTLVIFSSDNGPWLFFATDEDVPQGGYDSGVPGPLRQGKGTTFEGGIRVPMIVRWPGQIPAGLVEDEAAVMTDWLPTLAGLAGADLPDGVDIDGKDIMPVLAGSAPRDKDQGFRYLQWRADGPAIVGAYREGDWKFKTAVAAFEVPYAPYTHDDLLFNLADDIGEQNDLSEAMPERLAEMKENALALAEEVAGGCGPPEPSPPDSCINTPDLAVVCDPGWQETVGGCSAPGTDISM